MGKHIYILKCHQETIGPVSYGDIPAKAVTAGTIAPWRGCVAKNHVTCLLCICSFVGGMTITLRLWVQMR